MLTSRSLACATYAIYRSKRPPRRWALCCHTSPPPPLSPYQRTWPQQGDNDENLLVYSWRIPPAWFLQSIPGISLHFKREACLKLCVYLMQMADTENIISGIIGASGKWYSGEFLLRNSVWSKETIGASDTGLNIFLISNIFYCRQVVYQDIQKALLLTPSKSHYTFNLRDLAKVIQGILMVEAKNLPDIKALARLWCHECSKVFR